MGHHLQELILHAPVRLVNAIEDGSQPRKRRFLRIERAIKCPRERSPADDLAPGTLGSILKQAQLNGDS